jgi:quercetin dioxygenase-like cupin family protein
MSIQEIFKTDDVSVRIMELEKNTSTDWHYHTEIRDYCVCLNGVIRVDK